MYNTPGSNRRRLLAPCLAGLVAASGPALGQMISEDRKLLALDGQPEVQFGNAIGIDNGVIVVGTPKDNANGTNSGSAYLFDAATGVQLAKLLPNDGSEDDWFGWSVAIDDGVVAVGARYDDDNGHRSGSAYLFDAATGAQLATLLPSDGAKHDHFGYSIATDNGIVAVGARGDDVFDTNSGSAYLFDANTGAQLAKLTPNDGAHTDEFGHSIAIGCGLVAVGARWANPNGDNSGAAYVFDAATGVQVAKLVPDDGEEGENFGWSIAIDSGIVAVGARLDNDNGSLSGSAYLFDATTGAQLAKLLPSDGGTGNQFGWSIAMHDGIVAVGADEDADNGDNAGSAYLFDATTGTQLAGILPSDGARDDRFARSIALDSGTIAVGAWEDNDNGNDAGSAYVFSAACPADVTRDGAVNTQDFIAYLGLWAAGDRLADWTMDDLLNTQDFIAFLNDWNTGC